jgi:hypothetical protein
MGRGSDKKRKRQVASSSNQSMFPFMQPMVQPMMQPMMQPATQQPALKDDDESSYSSDDPAGKKRKIQKLKDEKSLCNSSHTLIQLPVSRLQQLVEVVDSAWDNVATEDLSPEDLSRIIWMFTDIKPWAKVHKYKCSNYKELCLKFDNAVQRAVQIKGKVAFDDMKRAVYDLTPESIAAVSDRIGFQMEWVVEATRKTGKAKPSTLNQQPQHGQANLDQYALALPAPAPTRLLALMPAPPRVGFALPAPPKEWPLEEAPAAPADQFRQWSSSGSEWNGGRGGNWWHHEAMSVQRVHLIQHGQCRV